MIKVIRREASISLCAFECGACCCRSPFRVTLDREELNKLVSKAKLIGVQHILTRSTENPDWFEIVFADNNNVCPLLDLSTNLCRVYEDRPSGCRKFPERGYKECLVWPLGGD